MEPRQKAHKGTKISPPKCKKVHDIIDFEQGIPEWFNERRVRLTASLCKDIVSIKSDREIMNFFNKHLWKNDYMYACFAIWNTNERIARVSSKTSKTADGVW